MRTWNDLLHGRTSGCRGVACVVIVFSFILSIRDAHALDSEPAFNTQPTAEWRNGKYSYSKNHSGTCSHNGGVAQWQPRICWTRMAIDKPNFLWLKSGTAQCQYQLVNGRRRGTLHVDVNNSAELDVIERTCKPSFCGVMAP